MEKERTILPAKKRLYGILAGTAILLSIPLIAMQFTKEVDWSPFDFLAMGILLLATGLGCELVIRKVKSNTSRVVVSMAVVAIFLLVWAELAVGIFGTPFAGN